MTITRQKILALLQKRPAATATELAQALDTGAANVRHHLSVLAADGRVAVTGKKHEGRGPPEKLYSLSRALRGDNLPGLLGALLDMQLAGRSETEKEESMLFLGQCLAAADPPTAAPLVKRLADLMERLNKLHYEARWEAGAEGPHVILGNCPYAAVIEAHPELCRADAAMLEASLEMRAAQKTRREPACLFLLR